MSKDLCELLESCFELYLVDLHSYSNSLLAVAELRGIVISELDPPKLDVHNRWPPLEVCARVVKRVQP